MDSNKDMSCTIIINRHYDNNHKQNYNRIIDINYNNNYCSTLSYTY